MGLDPISLAMMGTQTFKAYQQYEAGKEAKETYDAQAVEFERQTAYAQRMGLEEQKDLTRQGRSERSRARAAAGKSGVRVGGSVSTLTDSINRAVSRRKAMVGFQFDEKARRNTYQAGQYRKAGRTAKKAAGIEAVGSLLTGGAMVAKHQYDTGAWWNKDKR